MKKYPPLDENNPRMIIIFIIVGLLIATGIFLVFFQSEVNENNEIVDFNISNNETMVSDGQFLSNYRCTGTDKPLITHSPMEPTDFPMIIPYGLMIDSHVTPIDHQYFEPADYNSPPDSYPVYAMADARLVDIGTRTSQFGSDEYRLVFSMSCNLFYYYDLLTSLSPLIMNEFEKKGSQINIPVFAGQEIGRIGGQTLDFAVWDMDEELDGFIVPEHYEGEAWKIHTVDPLLYYTDELKEILLPKYIRTTEPISGKIDHDIDGTLQGTWFLQGYPGYTSYDGPEGYWHIHISFSPDHIDPSGFVVSLGNWVDGPMQFGVIDNSPFPKDVTIDSGVTKYDLTQINYKTPDGNFWDRKTLNKPITFESGGNKFGCLLVQLNNSRELQIEKFPNQDCSSINDFDNNIEIFTR